MFFFIELLKNSSNSAQFGRSTWKAGAVLPSLGEFRDASLHGATAAKAFSIHFAHLAIPGECRHEDTIEIESNKGELTHINLLL